MATDIDRLADILSKALPPERQKERVVMRAYDDPSPWPVEGPGERLLVIELVPLQRPPEMERADCSIPAGKRTYGEEVEPFLETPVPDALQAMLEKMRDGTAGL